MLWLIQSALSIFNAARPWRLKRVGGLHDGPRRVKNQRTKPKIRKTKKTNEGLKVAQVDRFDMTAAKSATGIVGAQTHWKNIKGKTEAQPWSDDHGFLGKSCRNGT